MEETSNRLTKYKEFGFDPKNILDIGAHMGHWTIMCHGVFPKAKYVMIEANDDCSKNLEKIKIKETAIAVLGKNDEEEVNYYKSTNKYTTGNSIYKEQTNYFRYCDVEKRKTITLDTLSKIRKWPKFDLIKVDTQGSELDIVMGGANTFKKAEVVILETQLAQYNAGAPLFDVVITQMAKLGFKVYDFLERVYLSSDRLVNIDVVFVKEDSFLLFK